MVPSFYIFAYVFPALVSIGMTKAAPKMRTAPEECPLQNGNLIDTILFVEDNEFCENLCSKDEKCLYYFYYAGTGSNDIDVRSQPAQCFLYDECERSVQMATENCPLTRENTVFVQAFTRDEKECQMSCSRDDLCGYYKYFSSRDEKQPMMCYHLKSCSPRIIKREECPIEVNNYIDHTLFTKTPQDCLAKCEDTPGCRFYFWYPIDYSPAPLYCYLFRSCEGGADEPKFAMISAGRHPGHYFLDQEESLDMVRPGAVCEKKIMPNTTEVGRAGSVSEFVKKRVILCGGKDHSGEVKADCLSYHPKTNEWEEHSTMNAKREEAASVVMGNDMYVIGGFIGGERVASSEKTDDDNTWVGGPEMPEPRSRFCAVQISEKIFAILGGDISGDNGDEMATMHMKTYDIDNEEWSVQPEMRQKRKDHACIIVEINDEKGILVTGGVDENDNLLNSVEFYSLTSESWSDLANLKHGRTEHGMALVSGMATVIGGVSDDEFLRSIEVLDNSADDDSPSGMDWRTAAHALTRPRYDFSVASIPISALPANERNMEMCKDSSVTISAFQK